MWLTFLSWGSKLLPILRSPKVLLSASVATAFLLGYMYVGSLKGKIEELTETKAQITAFYQQCQDANAQVLADIRTISEANREWASKLRSSEEERIQAVKEATERAMRAEARLGSTLESLESMRNETPDCKALSEIDMGSVCPAVVDRLREHALGPNN